MEDEEPEIPTEDDEPEVPTEEPLHSAATESLQPSFLTASDALIAELNRVGHTLRRDTCEEEPLSTRYISAEVSSVHTRLAVAFDVTVSAFRFGESRLRPAEEYAQPTAATDWSRFAPGRLRADASNRFFPELQTALETELRCRLWEAAKSCARAHDTPDDDFRFVDIEVEEVAKIDYCAFGRGLHLGFTFTATVWQEPDAALGDGSG